MIDRCTRRDVLKSAGVVAVGAFASGVVQAAAPKATVASVEVISHQPHLYGGWPTLTRRADDELLLVWSGGREAHVCPFGQVHMMQSPDGGRTWTFPRVLIDSAIDDRDAGILVTEHGTLLATTFTSLAYEPALKRPKLHRPGMRPN